jgi:DNA polymerase-3 subunit alpha
MNIWANLHCHSHYSLLDGLSQPHQLAERCASLQYPACAITDHGSVSGVVQFMKALKNVCVCGHQKAIHSNKKCQLTGCRCQEYNPFKCKPILGCEFYICKYPAAQKDNANRPLSHLVVLAKNLEGWKGLIQAVSEASRPENVYYDKPRLSLEELAQFSKGNWVAFSGHPGSDLGNIVFKDKFREAYRARTFEEAEGFLSPTWQEDLTAATGKHIELFGRENFFMEIQLVDYANLHAQRVMINPQRKVARALGIETLATADCHYPSKEDAPDQRVLLCSQFKTTLSRVEGQLERGEDVTLGGFFRSNSYYMPRQEYIDGLNAPEECKTSLKIAEMCEEYDILSKPILPHFDCPHNHTPESYLRELAREGWKNLIWGKIAEKDVPKYIERINHELEVLTGAGLSSYFLIVQDYCNWARNQGMMLNVGRGSSAGSLLIYLLGITEVDPIPNNLFFERFYNAGRNTADRVSLPDVDTDVPKYRRPELIEYIEKKYGADRVSQMVTFQTLKGRSAITTVLSVHEAAPFDEIKKISKQIPADSQISGDLQEMKEETGTASIIRWALENIPAGLKDYCYLDKKGNLQGPMAIHFAQAIRLEYTKKASSKHASGIVIGNDTLSNICPMMYDKKDKKLMLGVEMNDAEAMGLPKFDILGLALLDKLQDIEKDINGEDND